MIYGSPCPSPTYKSMHIVDVIHAFFLDMVFENWLYVISAHGYIFVRMQKLPKNDNFRKNRLFLKEHIWTKLS